MVQKFGIRWNKSLIWRLGLVFGSGWYKVKIGLEGSDMGDQMIV